MKKESKFAKVFITVKNILSWIILAAVVVFVVTIFISRITGDTPSVMGYSFLRVSTGSMEPALKVGDIILMKSCEADTLKKGDIVSYKGTRGDMAGKIITHRVIEPVYESEGKTYITTCGDANEIKDPPVTAEQVLGKMERQLPLFTKGFNFFITPLGLLTVIVLIILAFMGDIINFVKALTNTGKTGKERRIEDIVKEIKEQELENAKNAESQEEEF